MQKLESKTARLRFSKIGHVDTGQDNCIFKSFFGKDLFSLMHLFSKLISAIFCRSTLID